MPQQPALYSKLSVAENLALFARLERVADPDAAVARMLEQTGLRERAAEQLSRLSGGNRQRVNVAIGLLSRPPVLALDEPSTALDPGQRERLWSFIRGLAAEGTSVVFSTHDVGEVQRYASRALVLADGGCCSTAPPRSFSPRRAAIAGSSGMGTLDGDPAGARGGGDFEDAFVSFLRARGAAMSSLLRKDLLILRRSRLTVALLVVYPVAIALLIGLALSRGPSKPRVAVVNETTPGARVEVGGRSVDVSAYATQLFDQVEAVPTATRAQAVAKIQSGDVLAAVVIPHDIAARLSSDISQAHLEVLYNGDALEQSLVQSSLELRARAGEPRLLRTDPARRRAGDRPAAQGRQPRRARRARRTSSGSARSPRCCAA